MLVLARKKGQKIELGPNVLIHVLSINGSTVRIGIEAPQSVRARRFELPPNAAPTLPVETAARVVT